MSRAEVILRSQAGAVRGARDVMSPDPPRDRQLASSLRPLWAPRDRDVTDRSRLWRAGRLPQAVWRHDDVIQRIRRQLAVASEHYGSAH